MGKFGSLRQVDLYELEASLAYIAKFQAIQSYMVRSCLNNKQASKQRTKRQGNKKKPLGDRIVQDGRERDKMRNCWVQEAPC